MQQKPYPFKCLSSNSQGTSSQEMLLKPYLFKVMIINEQISTWGSTVDIPSTFSQTNVAKVITCSELLKILELF